MYIGLVVLFINWISTTQAPNTPDTLLIPMAMLALLVLSVLVMGYVLLLQPITLFVEGRRAEAIKLFGYTVLSMAGVTVVLLGAMLYASLY